MTRTEPVLRKDKETNKEPKCSFVTTRWTRSVRSGHNQTQTRSVGGQRILTKGGRNGREKAAGSLMTTGGMLHRGAGMKHVARHRDKKKGRTSIGMQWKEPRGLRTQKRPTRTNHMGREPIIEAWAIKDSWHGAECRAQPDIRQQESDPGRSPCSRHWRQSDRTRSLHRPVGSWLPTYPCRS